jgi:hypothetical protein
VIASNWTEEDTFLVAGRAHALYQQGCYREAAILFAGLLAIEPANNYCREAMATICLVTDQPADALDWLSPASAHPETLARRCEALICLNRFAEARRELERLGTLGCLGLFRRMQQRFRVALVGNASASSLDN